MKIKKIYALLLVGILSAGFATKYFIELYTQSVIDKIASIAVLESTQYAGWGAYYIDQATSQPKVLHLGDMLYINIHANKPSDEEEWWAAGDYTSEKYKEGWRKTVATSPQLAYTALGKFGPGMIKSFEKNLEIRKQEIITKWEDGAERAPIINKFSLKQFWADERAHMQRYVRLCDALLALPDSKLNEYIAQVYDEGNGFWSESDTQLQTWLREKQLVSRLPNDEDENYNPVDGLWYPTAYPVDLIFLTYRVNRDFPTWSNRRFLNESKKFIIETQKLLPAG